MGMDAGLRGVVITMATEDKAKAMQSREGSSIFAALAEYNKERASQRDGRVDYCCEVVLKEAREEDVLVRQLLYMLLSTYTNNLVNLAINAPTGTGKTHTIMRVVNLFPKADVVLLAGTTDKALFHREGILVVKNELGEYEAIDKKLDAMSASISDKELELIKASTKESKVKIRTEKELLERERAAMLKDAKKLIDLSHRVLVFLDTPSISLFAAIMPLLSHDAWEVEYDFVDTFHGIKTHSNVLRGWPAVIFAQAIDSSHYQRWPEIQRRFIVTNPKMSAEKIKKAVSLTSAWYGLPDALYQRMVVSQTEKNEARKFINELREEILEATAACRPGKNNVYIPFRETIEQSLPTSETLDMTVANRFFAWLSLLPVVKTRSRPQLVLGNETCTMATFDDLREALVLVEYASGLRPYVLQWFNDIFLAACSEGSEGISTKQLCCQDRDQARAGFRRDIFLNTKIS